MRPATQDVATKAHQTTTTQLEAMAARYFMAMKQKEHHFTLVVKTDDSRRGAELAVLSSFAQRNPDGFEFHLRRAKPKTPKK